MTRTKNIVAENKPHFSLFNVNISIFYKSVFSVFRVFHVFQRLFLGFRNFGDVLGKCRFLPPQKKVGIQILCDFYLSIHIYIGCFLSPAHSYNSFCLNDFQLFIKQKYCRKSMIKQKRGFKIEKQIVRLFVLHSKCLSPLFPSIK